MAEAAALLLAALAAVAVLVGLWLFAHGLHARRQARAYKRLVEEQSRRSKAASDSRNPRPSTGKPGAIPQPAAIPGDLQCLQHEPHPSPPRS